MSILIADLFIYLLHKSFILSSKFECISTTCWLYINLILYISLLFKFIKFSFFISLIISFSSDIFDSFFRLFIFNVNSIIFCFNSGLFLSKLFIILFSELILIKFSSAKLKFKIFFVLILAKDFNKIIKSFSFFILLICWKFNSILLIFSISFFPNFSSISIFSSSLLKV